ncbi:unnamed protein product [Phytomonas sp. Hart1]|nr:unnamed protein product [Phytomonas sp. Hart1]|eukprot:CCW70443.1 unnamed protein product [Phytomonas sp. isolate Hart1]
MSSDKSNDQDVHVGSFFIGNCKFSVYEEMSKQLQKIGWKRMKKSQLATCDFILGDRFTIPYHLLRCELLPPHSIFNGTRWINYFQGSHKITLKASMTEILRQADSTHTEWLPISFVLGGDPEKVCDERALFVDNAINNPSTLWIIKPSSGGKGQDILLVSGTEVIKFVETLESTSKRRYVAQKYVDSPLLVSHYRKFDIRVWVLLISPNYTIYAFSKGCCRTASSAYDLSDVTNLKSHLTNHCLQDEHLNDGEYEESNEICFDKIESYAKEKMGVESLLGCILPQMTNIIVRSLLTVKAQLEVPPNDPSRCFQLLGYDFIVDTNFRVWLLEINGSPGVAVRYLEELVQKMQEVLISSKLAASPDPSIWDVNKTEFVELWCEGHPLPQGLLL